MSERVVGCPHCGQEIAIPGDYAEASASCPSCAGEFGLDPPEPESTPAPAAAGPVLSTGPVVRRPVLSTGGAAGVLRRGPQLSGPGHERAPLPVPRPGIFEILFSFNGRMRRSSFWGIQLLSPFAFGLLIIGFALPMGISLEPEEPLPDGPLGVIFALVILVAYVLWFWVLLTSQVKRWHDRDKSGAWIFIGLIPVVGAVWQLIECGFMGPEPGYDENNRFGFDPRRKTL